jgi:hypothetical protein
MGFGQRRKRGNNYNLCETIGGCDAHQAAQARVMPCYEPINRCCCILHRFALAQNRLSGGGDRKSLGRAAEELRSKSFLESGDPASDRHMIDTEGSCRPGRASIAGNGQKEADIIPLPHRSAPWV